MEWLIGWAYDGRRGGIESRLERVKGRERKQSGYLDLDELSEFCYLRFTRSGVVII